MLHLWYLNLYVNYILPSFLSHILLEICRCSTFCGLTFWRRSAAEAASIWSRALAGQNESNKQNSCQSGRKWYVLWIMICIHTLVSGLILQLFFLWCSVSCLWHSLTLIHFMWSHQRNSSQGCRNQRRETPRTVNGWIGRQRGCIVLQWFAIICSFLQFLTCFAKAEFPRCVAAPKSERACAAAGEAVNVLRTLKVSWEVRKELRNT